MSLIVHEATNYTILRLQFIDQTFYDSTPVKSYIV